MLRRVFVFLAVAFLGLPGAACAQATAIEALHQVLNREMAARDSLQAARVLREREVEQLSAAVDSLKRKQGSRRADGALEKALQQSLVVALALEDLYRREEEARERVQAVREQLRQAYDLEINRLLSAAPDSAGVARLQALQRGRIVLLQTPGGFAPETAVPQVAVRPDDGPDDIRQKAELMADVAASVHREAVDTQRRLKQLQEEQRLRGRVETFANELFLFDESLPEGRSVSVSDSRPQGEETRKAEGNFQGAELAPSVGIAAEDATAGPPDVVLGREVLMADQPTSGSPLEGDALSQEIRRLQARHAALTAREKQVSARAKLLREYLEKLLGDAP